MSHQQPLFEIEPAPWELDAAQEQFVATVVFPGRRGKRFRLQRARWTARQLEPGRRVRVPFGRGDRMHRRLLRAVGNTCAM